MSILNAVLRGLFDGVLFPFRGAPALVGVAVMSLVLGVLMLFVFKATSNQAKIEAVKRKIHAGIFEIRLFNDDLRAIFRAQGEVLRHNLRYVGLSLVPLAWMLIPVVLFIAQMQFHYGFEGLAPGETTLLHVELEDGWAEAMPDAADPETGRPLARLEAPDGVTVESEAIWFPSRDEIVWRVRPETAGSWDLKVSLGSETWTKSVDATDDWRRRSPERLEPTFLNQLLYPAEAALPGSAPIRAITLPYPTADVWFFGLRLHWLIVFFVLSIVFAFALKDRFGVKI
jgi:hypothetical protein